MYMEGGSPGVKFKNRTFWTVKHKCRIEPSRRIGLVNIVFVCKINAFYASSVRGGEGKLKGREAVGFEQGT
jgi:hypothetical protein